MIMVNDLEKWLREIITSKNLVRMIISSRVKKDNDSYSKVQVLPYLSKEETKYQCTYFYKNKVIHQNYDEEGIIKSILDLMKEFKQNLITGTNKEYHLLVSRDGKFTILEKSLQQEIKPLSHNKEKNYLLKDNTQIPFLIELGVMNVKGKVLNDKYDKFKQINRFLEFVDDVVTEFDENKIINIIDFGCGKSYLTFAIHYYLTEIKHFKVNIVGLDLKENVIQECNEVVRKYNLEGIRFEIGDIKDYKETSVDLVVTLHACDTATDYALYNAIKWNAKVILSVPCCQHELNHQIKANDLDGLTDYGIIKERFSALLTDVTRAELLEINGYKTQLLEFIDMEHTPKNILIRAIKRNQKINTSNIESKLQRLKNEFNYEITLDRLLNK